MMATLQRRQLGALTIATPLAAPALAQTGAPIKIGYGMALSGPLAAAGRSAHIATEIWRDDVNGRGGILGRRVELVALDDQSTPGAVPAIYTKLLDVDRVDVIMSGYATNQIAPAMPIAIQRRKLFLGLHGLGVNETFRSDRYFHVVPYGPNPGTDWMKGFMTLLDQITPRPTSIGFLYADAEFAQNSIGGLRTQARALNLRVAYDQSYPMATVDMSALVRGLRAADPEVVVVLTYPQHTGGFVRAVGEIGLGANAKLVGGGMVGPQFATLLQQLGPALNGYVNFHFFVPEPSMTSPATTAFLERYQPVAAAANVDPLGFYVPTFAYARCQVLEAAITATRGLDDAAMAAHIRANSFDTVVGPVRFGLNGERREQGAIFVQYRGIQPDNLEQFRGPGRQVILAPAGVASGRLVTPFAEARR